MALRFAPYDATARARFAEQLISADASNFGQTAHGLATDALRRDPVQAVALRVLGLEAEGGSTRDEPRALSLMLAAQRLSKRDSQTQLWLINHYGRQGDVEAMVDHFDLALRSSERVRSSAFPLVDAVSLDPQGKVAIVARLRQRPNWAVPYASFAAEFGQNLQFATEVAKMFLDPRNSTHRDRYIILLRRLVAEDQASLAWDLYTDRSLGLGGNSGGSVRNGTFEERDGVTPFDWSFAQEPELWAARERSDSGSGSVLRLAAYNGRSGEVASQVLHLSPGSHVLSASMGDLPADSFERPGVRLVCLGGGATRTLAILSPNAGGAGPVRLQENFVVPRGCAFQRLVVNLSGDGPLVEPSPWLDDLSIN